jgi:type I restriction enzyme S subunit
MSDLPPSWEWAKLGDIALWSSGGTPKSSVSEYYDGDIPWVVTGDLTDSRVHATSRSITQLGLAKSSAKLIPAETVLVAMYGASIGRAGIAAMSLATNQAIANAQVYPQVADPKYVLYYLLSQRSALVAAGKGAAQPNIGQGTLKEWPIPIAPLADQAKIVAAIEEQFSRLDAGIAALQRAQGNLQRSRAAILDAAVSGELMRIPNGYWEELALGELVDDIHAGKSFKCEERPAGLNEWGVVKVSAMTWGRFRENENKTVVDNQRADPRYEIHPGDLLVSRANTVEYVGAAVLVGHCRPRLLLSDKSLRLAPNAKVLPGWLLISLRTSFSRRYIESVATGTSDSMRNISQPKLRALRVTLPPVQIQARLIAEVDRIMSQMERLGGSLNGNRRSAQALRSSILSAAFSGKLI